MKNRGIRTKVKKENITDENGLHYHLGYRYQGLYRDEMESGEWNITKNNVLISTCDFKNGFMDGEMKLYNEDGEIIGLVYYTKGQRVDTLLDIINVEEIERVLKDLSKDYEDLWKIEDDGNGGKFQGEGFLLSCKDLEKFSRE